MMTNYRNKRAIKKSHPRSRYSHHQRKVKSKIQRQANEAKETPEDEATKHHIRRVLAGQTPHCSINMVRLRADFSPPFFLPANGQ